MQPWMFAIIAATISFIVFKFINIKNPGDNEDSTTSTSTSTSTSNESGTFRSNITTFGSILVGCMIISYLFNITGNSIMGEKLHNNNNNSINPSTILLSDDMERNIVNNIIQDINVGFLPF